MRRPPALTNNRSTPPWPLLRLPWRRRPAARSRPPAARATWSRAVRRVSLVRPRAMLLASACGRGGEQGPFTPPFLISHGNNNLGLTSLRHAFIKSYVVWAVTGTWCQHWAVERHVKNSVTTKQNKTRSRHGVRCQLASRANANDAGAIPARRFFMSETSSSRKASSMAGVCQACSGPELLPAPLH